jgi:hypothetical protein
MLACKAVSMPATHVGEAATTAAGKSSPWLHGSAEARVLRFNEPGLRGLSGNTRSVPTDPSPSRACRAVAGNRPNERRTQWHLSVATNVKVYSATLGAMAVRATPIVWGES